MAFKNTWYKMRRSQIICYEIKLMIVKLRHSHCSDKVHSAVGLFAPWLSPYSWSVSPRRNNVKNTRSVHTR